jgi:signal transduction histidine kinase
MNTRVDRLVTRIFRKVPLKVLLTVPSFLQILIVAGLTGWLSWLNAHAAVNRLAGELQDEIGDRIHLRLKTYLDTPQMINRINVEAVRLGQIDLDNKPAVERHLFSQLMQFNDISSIMVGTTDGQFRAVNRQPKLQVLRSDGANQPTYPFALNGLGKVTAPSPKQAPTNLEKTLWYQNTAIARKPIWSTIFQTGDNRDLSLNANYPIYDEDSAEFVGVLSAGFSLTRIDDFLDTLKVSPSGLVFIVENDGELIGTSAEQSPYKVETGSKHRKLRQVNARESSDPLIRSTAHFLVNRYGDFDKVVSGRQLEFTNKGAKNFVKVVPYRDDLGLDWLIVVVVPEADFMAQINANMRNTIWLCTAAAVVAILLGIAMSNWVADPMQRLSRASRAIADGEFAQQMPDRMPIREVEVTIRAFNQMSSKLSESFEQIESALQESREAQKALHQREQDLQRLNTTLEVQVEDRTAQLQQALNFEDLLKRITDKVRDSLDQSQILQTVVRELANGLDLPGCDVALYDLDAQTSTILYEHLRSPIASAQGKVIPFAQEFEVYDRLLKSQWIQFCLLFPAGNIRPQQYQMTILACPLVDDQGILGDMWLFKSSLSYFTVSEVRLVQQVANQCAIALRQSRLYERAQDQVEELERLNRLKDDFLSTVSHELRTPMSNIKMATQMLEINLKRLGTLDSKLSDGESSPVPRYFQILKDEGQREINLINNLLDLSRLEAKQKPLNLSTLDPNTWLEHIIQPFLERARNHQQHLSLEIQTQLPEMTTDLTELERVLHELLNNACKYTPAGESIQVIARMQAETLHETLAEASSIVFSVVNTGTEIPLAERDRIFDKFYRIPSNDPWKHGGTGLGLALVKGLVERLQGSIELVSGAGKTAFIVRLPLVPVGERMETGIVMSHLQALDPPMPLRFPEGDAARSSA